MKVNTIINRYIFKEMILPFFICLFFFIFVFLMAKIFIITDLIVNYNVGFMKVVEMIAYMIPVFLEYVIPISVMITVLLTFLKVSGDGEIIAMESSGISLFELLPPVIFFCFLGSIFAGLVSTYGVPWSKSSIRKSMSELGSQNLFIVELKERKFIDTIDGVTIFISSIDKNNGILHDVFIKDQRERNLTSTIISPRGTLFTGKDTPTSFIRLYDGYINQVDLQNKLANTIRFNTYDMRLNQDAVTASKKKKKKHRLEMTITELWHYIKTTSNKNAAYFNLLTEFNLKFSLPASCLVLGILALPLGTLSSKVKKSYGLASGLFFMLIYYILLSAGRVVGESGTLASSIAVWFPNVILFIIALFLLIRVSNNKPLINRRMIHNITDYFLNKTA